MPYFMARLAPLAGRNKQALAVIRTACESLTSARMPRAWLELAVAVAEATTTTIELASAVATAAATAIVAATEGGVDAADVVEIGQALEGVYAPFSKKTDAAGNPRNVRRTDCS